MRKITREAFFAFRKGLEFKKSNTRVQIELHSSGYDVNLLLHGNVIARRKVKQDSEEIWITNAGWFSNTTKERLNGIPGVSINQSNFVWYLNRKEWNGEWTKI